MKEEFEPEPINQIELKTQIKNCAICNHPVSEINSFKFKDEFVCKNCFHEPLRSKKIKELMKN